MTPAGKPRNALFLLIVLGPLGGFLVWRQLRLSDEGSRNLSYLHRDYPAVKTAIKKVEEVNVVNAERGGGAARSVDAPSPQTTKPERTTAEARADHRDDSAPTTLSFFPGDEATASSDTDQRAAHNLAMTAAEIDVVRRRRHSDDEEIGRSAIIDDYDDNDAAAFDPSRRPKVATKTTTSIKTPICVRERTRANPQQSIWKTIERYGSGRYHFVTAIDARGMLEDGYGAEEGGGRKPQCDRDWPVVLSLNEMGKYLRGASKNLTRADNVVLTYHRGDENCRYRDWSARYRGIKPDFTTYWDSNDAASSWNVTSSKSTAHLPLGPQFGFRPVEAKEIVPPEKRKYLFNFAGTLSTSKSRQHLARVLKNWGSRFIAPRANVSAEERTSSSGIFEKERLVVTPTKFQTALSRHNRGAKGGYMSSEDYRETLLQSVFTLCPSGHNPESYRLFEAAEAGSIPVVTLDGMYNAHPCGDSFLPFIESGAPFVYLSKWGDLEETLAKLASSPSHVLEQWQERVREWHRNFMAKTSERVERLLESRLRDGSSTLPTLRTAGSSINFPEGINLPVIVIGLNKAGTSTIRDYFLCGGAKTSHYFCGTNGRGPLCAAMIKSNILNGKPPLSGEVDWEVYAELNSHKVCYFPQMESLDEIHRHYPNATFILNLRNTTDWANSVKNWGHGRDALPIKLVQCDLPGLPKGVGSKNEELVAWFEMHTERVRSFVSRHPSHKLIEVTIDTDEAGGVMEGNFGISSSKCWGHSNVKKKITLEPAERLSSPNCGQPPEAFSKIPQKNERHSVDWERVCAPEKFPSKKVPAFLLIGAQKAGTTAFFYKCANHPLIRRPKWKEFHYFAGRNMLEPGTNTTTWKRNYRFMFGDVARDCPECITGEGSPQYMRFPHTVIPKVQSVAPWVKIVVLLRDPIARALSAFHMRKKNRQQRHLTFEELVEEDFAKMKESGLLQNWTEEKGWVDFESFAGSKEEENALRKYEMNDIEIGFSDRSGVITSGILFRGMYELQLRQWVHAFGAEHVLVVNTDRDRVGLSVCHRFHNFVGLKSLEPRRLGDTDHGAEDIQHGARNERVQQYSSDLSTQMEQKLRTFFSPYNRRLEKLLGVEWAGDVWGF
mmetsp:Transcript_13850/g.40528  ORF Transcript_13850/g.40528 Transcript_13850/m.40528 type:complete len:1116 (-) Transcript_13850:48-3395(-)